MDEMERERRERVQRDVARQVATAIAPLIDMLESVELEGTAAALRQAYGMADARAQGWPRLHVYRPQVIA